MITLEPSLPITFSQLLYGIGIVLVVVGGIIVIRGLRMRRKEKKN